MEPRSGIIIAKNHPPIQASTHPSPAYLSFHCICALSPPLNRFLIFFASIGLCGVPPSASQTSKNFVRCPHHSLNIWTDTFNWNVRCPPLLCIQLSILCGVPTLVWTSDQIAPIIYNVQCPPALLLKHLSCQSSSTLNLYPRVWHSQLSLFPIFINQYKNWFWNSKWNYSIRK